MYIGTHFLRQYIGRSTVTIKHVREEIEASLNKNSTLNRFLFISDISDSQKCAFIDGMMIFFVWKL
jgi:hypothetical protein